MNVSKQAARLRSYTFPAPTLFSTMQLFSLSAGNIPVQITIMSTTNHSAFGLLLYHPWARWIKRNRFVVVVVVVAFCLFDCSDCAKNVATHYDGNCLRSPIIYAYSLSRCTLHGAILQYTVWQWLKTFRECLIWPRPRVLMEKIIIFDWSISPIDLK